MSAALDDLLDDPAAADRPLKPDVEALNAEAVRLLPEALATRLEVLGLAMDDKRLLLGMGDPTDLRAIDDVGFATGRRVVPVALGGDVKALVKAAYQGVRPSKTPTAEDLSFDDWEDFDEEPTDAELVAAERQDDAPVVKLVNLMLVDAINKQASDIRVRGDAQRCEVLFKRHGRWQVTMRPPRKLWSSMVGRVKKMSEIDHAAPATGWIHLRIGKDKEQHYRLAVRRVSSGEEVGLRLAKTVPFDDLFDDDEQQRLSRWSSDAGVVVGCARAGQGATVTARAVAAWLARAGRFVVYSSVHREEPVPGVSHAPQRADGEDVALALEQGADAIVFDSMPKEEHVLLAVRSGAWVWSVERAPSAAWARDAVGEKLRPFLRGVVYQELEHGDCDACGGEGGACEACAGVGRVSTTARFTFLEPDAPAPSSAGRSV